ncbi:hypothetical protein [Nonomuraea rhodomycinica]|uniref:Uncharacterized protein n=1 Tax=Nonomuraea rhodomycinica TaxID=1712872 RepID=A0A7Y6MHD4_9ACTN|nr:hypothetical protein [Nonomuraea rhodomycinica]NUW46864.1 hypothetical protein [Nonomuraea rhodomycinica]
MVHPSQGRPPAQGHPQPWQAPPPQHGTPLRPQPWQGPPPQHGAPLRPRPGRKAWRVVAGVVAVCLGLPAVLAGGGLVAHAVADSRQQIPSKRYLRNLWRNLPVETLFPATIGLPDPGAREAGPGAGRGWTRAAVSPETSCGKALSGDLAREAGARGCVAAVRASYVDDTGGSAATIAIVAFGERDDTDDLDSVLRESRRDERDYGVRVLSAPGLAWADGARAGSGAWAVPDPDTPLLVAVTSGPVDGRRPGRLPPPWGRGEIQQQQDRSPWAETSVGLAESVVLRLSDEIGKVRS